MAELSGQCQCGAVKFKAAPKIEPDGMHVDACHCSMCQRRIGGPLMAVNLTAAPVIEDDSQLGVYASSDWAERLFCKNCGSNLFYRLRDGSHHSVHAGALDDLSDANFTMEIFIDEKPDYYAFDGDRKKLTGQEVMAMFAGGQEDNNG